QLLIYPIITAKIESEPYDNSPDRHFLTKEAMQFMWGAYLQSEENGRNPYASVDCADDLSGLPPAVVISGEYDPLHVEARKYAESLKRAGVKVESKCFDAVIHGFLDLPIYDSEQKIGWVAQIKEMLDKVLKN
ncbi:MAG: alpha/beta hydrolase fold domain-containing protein, partial [Verrucomicrobia bacterium]|nr:alpha/beta hydrolase fold domain-containing protein [Verrucomicrobiota bacterium]